MPSVSKAQLALMRIAEHHPEKVSKKNKAVTRMSKNQLKEFAKPASKSLPNKKAQSKPKTRKTK